ncbi:MAG: hypothetical protein ACK4N5_00545 [Myxococcales bacterium]
MSSFLVLAASLLIWNPFESIDFKFPETEWLDRNTAIVYPALAMATLGLLVVGILASFKSDELTGMVKVEYKRELVHALRRNPGGFTLEEMVKLLKLKPKQVMQLLEEFEAEGILHTNLDPAKGKKKVWRLRGVGPY